MPVKGLRECVGTSSALEPVPAKAGGLSGVQQCGAKAYYRAVVVGDYIVDLLVEDVLPVELKTVKALDDAHRIQCTNYLKATGLQLCLLLNFGTPRLEIKRVVYGL
jgi:GxxExxY protein